ncbi:hypothetical protein [Sphingopyxis indica]|nr:hypothetical protein [Sphingopyxis indica]
MVRESAMRMAGIFGAACGLALVPAMALAVSMTSLKGAGMEADYGSYAPGGDCSREPRIAIGDDGFAFTAAGRTVAGRPFEWAASFFGNSYEGISNAFFPFPRTADDYGMVLLTTSSDEKRGTLLVESNVAPGQRIDAFEGAFVRPEPYVRCKGTEVAVPDAPPPAPAVPLDWTNLASLEGQYQGGFDAFDAGPVAAVIRSLMGPKLGTLKANLQVGGPLNREGGLYYFSGNAPHRGGEDQAYVLIDPRRRAVQVGLWERGSLKIYLAGSTTRLPLPRDIAAMVAKSPPEGAVAAPGTPWEVVPAEGRAPLAYVDAAASPRIRSITIFCDSGRPALAMLTVKPITERPVTLTWNFNGRTTNLAMIQSNREATFWQAGLSGSPLIAQIEQGRDPAYLRINGTLEGQAALTGASAALNVALKGCGR